MRYSNLLILISVIFLTVFGLGLIEKIEAATILSEYFDSTCYQGQQCYIPPPTGWATSNNMWALGRTPCGNIYRGSGYYAACAYELDPYSTPAMLATLGLSMSTSGSYTLTFYVRNVGSCAGGGNYTGLNVYRGTSQLVTGTQIGSTFVINSTTWTQKTINFTVPSNGTYYIQFVELSGSNDLIAIDDVVVNETIVNSAPSISSLTDAPDPVNAGSAITFPVYWSDPNAGDQTRIHICKTNAISTQTCSGGSWCDTASWSTTSPTSCSYTTQAGDVGTKNYWAFICDDDNACSSGWAGTFVVQSAVTPPTVTTDTATIDATAQLPSSQATLRGNITATGGQNADFRGFEWGTASGGPYSSGCQDSGSGCEGTSGTYQYVTGAFTNNFSLPAIGTTYYYRAKAHNSTGWGRGVEKRVVVYRADGGQKDFKTCQCSTYTAGGCCDGCYFCPVGTVSNGAPGQCVTPNSTYYCNSSEDCDDGDCSATKRWYGCTGTSTSCSTTSYQQENVYAQAGYTLTATCGTTGTTLCGYSGYNGCAGVGSPYSCQKKRDQLRCAADNTCAYDVGDNLANVATGYVCSGGTEMAASTTYYCGFSAYNSRSADKCDKKKDYLACNANVCNYGDYGDAYDFVTAYKIANASGTEADASSGDNAGTCHNCTLGVCSGFLRWGECDGAGSPVACAYYQEEPIYASAGKVLNSSCVNQDVTANNYCDYACDGSCRIGYRGCSGSGTSCETTFRVWANCAVNTACSGGACAPGNYCAANQCRDGGGWHHKCSKWCDGTNGCNNWADVTCADHCVNSIQDCDETSTDCGGSCASCVSTAPTTSISCNGAACSAGWYAANISITLTCTPAGGATCSATYYCTDQTNSCTPATQYTSAFTLSTEGTNYVRFYSVDNYNNTETTKSQQVKLDKTKPVSAITSPAAGSTQTANFSVAVTDTDNTGGSGLNVCYYSVTDSAAGQTRSATARTCSSSFTVTVGSDQDCRTVGGTCTVYVYAYDTAGNLGDTTSRTFNVGSTTAPTTSISCNGTTCSTGWYTANVSITLTCTPAGGATCSATYYCTDQTNSCTPSAQYTGAFALSTEGTDYVRFYSVDSYNNTETTKSQQIKLDKTKPVSTITSPAAGSTQTVNFSVAVTDTDTGGSGLNVCYYYVTDSGAGQTRSTTARTCSSSFTVTVGSDQDCRTVGGTCTVYVYAYDTAGNLGDTTSRTFNVGSESGGGITVPTVVTLPADAVGQTSATLKGRLDNMGGSAQTPVSSCDVWFEYGTTPALGTAVCRQTKSSLGEFTCDITGLTPSTIYYFTAKAQNSGNW